MPLTEAGIYYADTSTNMSIADITAAMATSMGEALTVLQVVQGTTTTQFSTSSTSYVDTGLTATITPRSTTSKILVLVSQTGFAAYGGGANQFQSNIVRNSTQIIETNSQINVGGQTQFSISLHKLDSPSTVSATTYKTQAKVAVASSAIFLQWPPVSGTPSSTITLIEVAA